MARTDLSVENISRSGLNATQAVGDSANDHRIPNNDGEIFLRIDNGGASPSIWSAVPKVSPDGLTVPNKSVTVPNGEARYFGPFRTDYYNQDDGSIHIDVDQAVSVTVETLRCPRT
jgi:hypothetical protein